MTKIHEYVYSATSKPINLKDYLDFDNTDDNGVTWNVSKKILVEEFLAFLSSQLGVAITDDRIPIGTGTGIEDSLWEMVSQRLQPTFTGATIGFTGKEITYIYMAGDGVPPAILYSGPDGFDLHDLNSGIARLSMPLTDILPLIIRPGAVDSYMEVLNVGRPATAGGYSSIGLAKIGELAGYPDEMIIAHEDNFNDTDYAVWQDASGNTWINGVSTNQLVANGAVMVRLEAGKLRLLHGNAGDTIEIGVGIAVATGARVYQKGIGASSATINHDWTDAAEAIIMRLLDDGSLGIGVTTLLNAWLNIKGGTTTKPPLTIRDGVAQTGTDRKAGSINRVGDELFYYPIDNTDPINITGLLGNIDQDVKSGSSPTFNGVNITGLVTGTVEQVHVDVRKGSAGTITKGNPVYISGYNASGYVEVEVADANVPANMPAIALTIGDVTNSATVIVVSKGKATGLDTSIGTIPGAAVNAPVYVAVGGGLTTTKPVGNDDIQAIGLIARVHASAGVIQVTGAGRVNEVPNIGTFKQVTTTKPATHVPVGLAQAIDWNEGMAQAVDLGSATGTVVFTFSNPVTNGSYFIPIIQGATPRNITLPANVLIPGGSAPNTIVVNSVNDSITGISLYYDGTNYLAQYQSSAYG